MERELRQLYRQRGSALRRIEQVVVIRDSQDEVRDNMDSLGLIQQIGHTGVVVRGALPNSGHEDIGVVNNGEDLSMPDIVQDSIRNDTNITGYIHQEEEEENEGNEEGNETYDNDGDYEVQSEDKDEIGKTYSFEGMPLTKLSTSITSMAAIEVIMGLVTDVFGKHLASQSEENFRQSETRRERLSYKMDLKLFEKFAELLRTDLQDILDIHLSNNDMCYHMKQILRLKQDLTQEIVSVREQLLQHNNGKSKEAEKLRELETLVDLNNKLKSLNQ